MASKENKKAETETWKLYVYGHYDSRGGTTAIKVEDWNDQSWEAATITYVEKVCAIERDDPEYEEFRTNIVACDYLGKATITGTKNSICELKKEADMDDNGTNVLAYDQDPLEHGWPQGGVVELVVAKADENYRDGDGVGGRQTFHPNWNDDAFGFLIVDCWKMEETDGK